MDAHRSQGKTAVTPFPRPPYTWAGMPIVEDYSLVEEDWSRVRSPSRARRRRARGHRQNIFMKPSMTARIIEARPGHSVLYAHPALVQRMLIELQRESATGIAAPQQAEKHSHPYAPLLGGILKTGGFC